MRSVRGIADAIATWLAAIVYVAGTRLPIRGEAVLFQSHAGASLFGNPFHLARHVAQAEPRRVVYCVTSDPVADARRLGCTVKWVRKGSMRYLMLLARAGLLVNDTSFPPCFSLRHGQRYLQTWHGTPLKTLGRSVPGAIHSNLRNLQRNFLQATHILFPNDYTEAMLRRDFDLHLWRGVPIRRGYPRNDVLVRSPRQREGTLEVAYMPTWRGTHSAVELHSQLDATRELLERLDHAANRRFRIWVKLHPLVHGTLPLASLHNVEAFPDDVEAYDHLARCDVLVTDYSSVMVDFAASGRRVVLHVPDKSGYETAHGLSLDLSRLPFPQTTSADELVAALESTRHATNRLLEELIERETGTSAADVWRDFTGTIPDAGGRQRAASLILADSGAAPSARLVQQEIDACRAAGPVVLATPGDGPDTDWLARLAATNPDVAICPTVRPAGRLSHFLPALSSRSEKRRLFGAAQFELVRVVGASGQYDALLHELARDGCRVEFVTDRGIHPA